ncbi:NAD-dependent epimerase/dehydratase family protein [Cytobacillus sp. FJAT-54145]|uniref:NAD-dependent epimerase/dehydratase family protein n=1 Tax=Cytobacillus spartinae TaxID=3299023 RepID=A0ABW6KEI5_9BACI
MDNVLILGGTQFFGKRLVEKLLKQGKSVTIATRGKTKDPFGDRVQRLIIDREDKESIINETEGKNWDVVYDQTCYSPQEARDAAEALKEKVKRYIFTSTMAVYDYGTNNVEENFNPYEYQITYKGRRDYPGYEGYKEAKRASEAHLFQETNFEVVAIRFPIVIGKDDYTNRLKLHVEKVMGNEPIGIPNEEARYSFILSHEAASFLYEMGLSNFTGPVNPGCDGDISMGELMRKIEGITELKAKITNELTPENASPYALPGSWSINTNKVKELGYSFSDLHQTLDELIHYYKG